MTGNSIIIEEVKGIKRLEFELPNPGVHVLTATNGCGKTTLLVCLERLKNNQAFRNNFEQNVSSNVDSYMFSKITYVSNKNNSVTYTYRKGSNSWRPTTQTSYTLNDFNYSEIVSMMPLGQRVYVQAKRIRGGRSRLASLKFREAMASILENDKFLKLQKINTGETRGRKGAERRNANAFVISYKKRIGGEDKTFFYSESSFSLGEIYTLNLLYDLKQIKKNSLLVIDELEVALHPRVQVNLLTYLEKIAEERNLTVIISTHSSSLIKSCSSLIYMHSNSSGIVSVNYDSYPALALKEVAVEEDFQPDFVFFVEDESAQILLKEMIKQYYSVQIGTKRALWKVLPIGGYPEVLRFTRNAHDYLLNRSIGQFAFLDHDVRAIFTELRGKGNNRSEDENKLFELFRSQKDKLKYFEITPEEGIWNWFDGDLEVVQNLMDSNFPDSNLNIRRLILECKRAHPNKAINPRKLTKQYFKWSVKQLSLKTNESLDRVKHRIIRSYVENVYSTNAGKNRIRAIFGPIFR